MSLPLQFKAELGFLVAVSRRSGRRGEYRYTGTAQHQGKPIPSPPTTFDRLPSNADSYRHLKRQYLVRAQWAIEKLEGELTTRNSILEALRDNQGAKRANDLLTGWTVEFDGLAQENQADQCEWVGVKLTSPKFQAGSQDFQTQLKKILTILNKKYLTVPNSETRLKVAVYMHNYNATLEQMKATVALIWMVDPLLGEVHPSHCGPNSISSLGLQYTNLVRDSPLHLKTQLISAVQIEDPWSNHLSPSRRPLELLSHPGELREAKYRHGAGKILSANSIEDLIHLMDIPIQDARNYPQAASAYRIQASNTPNETAIWFNQHCGTLDLTEIENWTKFCLGVVQLSLEKTSASLPNLYPGLIYRSTIFAFLNDYGLQTLADYFEAKLGTSKIPDLKCWPLIQMTSFRGSDSSGGPTTSSIAGSTFPQREFPFIDSVNGNYSFGIELEMYIPVRPELSSELQAKPLPSDLLSDFDDTESGIPDPSSDSYWSDPSPQDGRHVAIGSFNERAEQIAEMITSKGPLALRRDTEMNLGMPNWQKKLAEHGIVPISGINSEYQTWTVMPDGSLKEWHEWAGYKRLSGVEVVSPVLGDNPAGWDNVVDVLSILRNNFRLLVTNGCGFHIHVAKGTEMLSIHLLRKVCLLMCCAENMIFHLCHPQRRANNWSKHIFGEESFLHENCEGWTDLDVPADFWEHVPRTITSNPRLVGALKKIWTATTAADLDMFLRPDSGMGKCCISLCKCRTSSTHDKQYKGTVEFRFLEGTLDPELIIRWGQLMIALFKFADLAPPEVWPAFLGTVLQCRPSGYFDRNVLRVFLRFLGLDNDFEFWAGRVDAMSKLDVNSKQRDPPDEDQEFISRIDDTQIATLRDDLCRRERIIPCLKRKIEGPQAPEPPMEPMDRARQVLEKIGCESESVERALKAVTEPGMAGPAKQSGAQAREEEMDELSKEILQLLNTSRSQAEESLKRYYGA
ncbi:hypothetical protein ACLX1H_007143 [Fusarium chlamydosporum]